MVCTETFFIRDLFKPIPDGITVGYTYESMMRSTNEGEGQVVLTIEVGNVGGAPRGFSVLVSTIDGTAVSGVDYNPVNQSILFDVGETSKTHTIFINDDTICEGDEDFSSAIHTVVGQQPISVTIPVATITILDSMEEECGMHNIIEKAY